MQSKVIVCVWEKPLQCDRKFLAYPFHLQCSNCATFYCRMSEMYYKEEWRSCKWSIIYPNKDVASMVWLSIVGKNITHSTNTHYNNNSRERDRWIDFIIPFGGKIWCMGPKINHFYIVASKVKNWTNKHCNQTPHFTLKRYGSNGTNDKKRDWIATLARTYRWVWCLSSKKKMDCVCVCLSMDDNTRLHVFKPLYLTWILVQLREVLTFIQCA